MTDVVTATEPVKVPRKPRPSEIAAKAAKIAKAKKPTKKLGRPLLYVDQTLVRMPKGTLKRIHAACRAGEGQGDFMRAAVDAELKRRRK